ncbi:DMT family transporter [Sphaerisporangium rubeum]|uniref:Drug/metabolite transporter (DMT)-like permease n=1 Tax=Sphaerisporangium rubeum TaxID=321317 RepID=A0A7X0IJ40_9ACTN|nr:DMT family transporter [Sphaerisporangium rubeum]MBB6476159.1 drug/metabolite transporter (DMT)-like permease [Sphaerisporangium rubeum]
MVNARAPVTRPGTGTAKANETGITARGALGAGTAMFLMGTLPSVSLVLHEYPVYGGQAMRYAGAAVLLLAFMRARGLAHLRLDARELGLLAALAATGLAAFNVFVIESTRHATPATAGTVVATVPVVLALLGPLLARRRPSPRIVVAAVLVAAGAAVVSGLGGGSLLGVLLAAGALACEVGFSLLAVPLLPRLGAIRVSAYTTAMAVPILLVAGLVADGPGVLRVPGTAETFALVYQAVVVTAFAFFCWYDALPRLGPERAGLFSGFLPVGTILCGVVLGLGGPTAADVAGTALVVAGLTAGLTRRRRPPPERAAGPRPVVSGRRGR